MPKINLSKPPHQPKLSLSIQVNNMTKKHKITILELDISLQVQDDLRNKIPIQEITKTH